MSMDHLELVARRARIDVAEVRKLEERRTWTGTFVSREPDTTIETRAAEVDESSRPEPGNELRIYGYSAVFDSDSELLYGFLREQVKRGAFKRVLRDNPDVRLLENHEGRAHARTTNGTLKLREDARGLYRDALLDDRRTDSRDLFYSIDRKDMSQSSFAFTIERDEWRYCDCVTDQGPEYMGCDCVWERDILEIGSLIDDSVVTYPAYSATSATVARESERSGERHELASDEEQRDTAPDTDTSLTHSVSDHAEAIRSWLIANGGQNVCCTDRGARAR